MDRELLMPSSRCENPLYAAARRPATRGIRLLPDTAARILPCSASSGPPISIIPVRGAHAEPDACDPGGPADRHDVGPHTARVARARGTEPAQESRVRGTGSRPRLDAGGLGHLAHRIA